MAPSIAQRRSARASTKRESPVISSDKENTSSKAVAKPKARRGKKGAIKNEEAEDEKQDEKPDQQQDEQQDDEWEELPHNMGRVKRVKTGSKPLTAVQEQALQKVEAVVSAQDTTQDTAQDIVDHGATQEAAPEPEKVDAPKKRKRTKKTKVEQTDGENKDGEEKKTKRVKKAPYGIQEGVSPFADYPRPTAEECHVVANALRAFHPDVKPRPITIPPPSEFVAGCGEVRSILDALIRTRLSAATTSKNSNSAMQGMLKRFGNAKSGIGQGSIDYEAVRLASREDVETAIKSGGLAKEKSKDIKAIVDKVYVENQERKVALIASKNDRTMLPSGAENHSEEQIDGEIALLETDHLSINHLYGLQTYEAIRAFVKYPGIGVKTAACVALFSMQRECFAVDTHVFRLAQWLGWLPSDIKGVTRDSAFHHLEVRIPDGLKYDLHQLFIAHGKKCPRCIASTGETSARWDEGCVIEHLLKRTGARKDKDSPVKPKGKKGAKKATGDAEEDEEDLDLDLESDVEPPKKKAKLSKPVKAAPNTATKRSGRVKKEVNYEEGIAEVPDISGEEEGSELEVAPPKKKTKTRKSAKATPAATKKPSAKAKKAATSSDKAEPELAKKIEEEAEVPEEAAPELVADTEEAKEAPTVADAVPAAKPTARGKKAARKAPVKKVTKPAAKKVTKATRGKAGTK